MKTKFYYLSILALLVSFAAHLDAHAQGCVAIRNIYSCPTNFDSLSNTKWQVSLNYRYFRSYKHFRGKDEETERVEKGTEVINNDNSILLGISYNVTKRFSVSAILPYLYIDRSSLYEHYGNDSGKRFHTSSKGLGDVRLMGYYTVLPNHPKFYLATGLGIKLPTGNYDYKDTFHKLSSTEQDSLVTRVVDQSIQPGDGGTGLILDIDAAFKFSQQWHIYVSGSYLSNPKNTNGVKRSANLTSNIPNSNEFSVVDQYVARLGARFLFKQWQFSAGGRIEGIPAKDLIGDSEGFRRPGYIISAEPSIQFIPGKHSFGINFPIALERNRVQNTIDIKRSQLEGKKVIGDAAFADWLISINYAYRF